VAGGRPAIVMPDGYPGPTQVPEARAWVALGARYVVTPAEAALPFRVIDAGEDQQSQFFVTPSDYAKLAAELEWVAGAVPRIGRRLAELPELQLVHLLVHEIVPSDAFAARDRHWLTDSEQRHHETAASIDE